MKKRGERRQTARPYTLRKPTAKSNKPVAKPEPTPVVPEVNINNPASQAKLELIQEKQREVEEAEKVKQLSYQMGNYFRELADCFKELTAATTNVGNTLENWDLIFSTMGETNQEKNEPSWVRFAISPNNEH